MGTMQTDYEKETWKFMLHVLSNGPIRFKPSNGTYVGKGKCGCILEIRSENTPSPMCSMQPVSWGYGCGLLCKNVKGNRARKDAGTRKRSTKNRSSL